jgi:hypothetical protein
LLKERRGVREERERERERERGKSYKKKKASADVQKGIFPPSVLRFSKVL